jgi:hypothetical protein
MRRARFWIWRRKGDIFMRLPNGERAIADLTKLRDYVLSPTHPRGRKARVFLSALGMTAADADELRIYLLEAARAGEAVQGIADEFGNRYTVDFEIARSGKRVRVRSSWIVLNEDGIPRMTTCYCLPPGRVITMR